MKPFFVMSFFLNNKKSTKNKFWMDINVSTAFPCRKSNQTKNKDVKVMEKCFFERKLKICVVNWTTYYFMKSFKSVCVYCAKSRKLLPAAAKNMWHPQCSISDLKLAWQKINQKRRYMPVLLQEKNRYHCKKDYFQWRLNTLKWVFSFFKSHIFNCKLVKEALGAMLLESFRNHFW